MTLSRPTLPALAVLVMLLTPLVLVTPMAFAVAAPLAVGAAFVFGMPRFGGGAKRSGPGELLYVEGLEAHPEVKDEIASELVRFWKDVPKESDPVACACVRREGDSWLGVLRTRTVDGHSYAQVQGASAAEAGAKVAETVRRYQAKRPVLAPEPVGYSECHEGRCPIGRKSVFYIDRDIHGRPGRRAD